MKLLNELISLRRINDEPEHEHTADEPNFDHIAFDDDDDDQLGMCPDCMSDPCMCDDDETEGEPEGDDENYSGLTDEFDSYGHKNPDDPVEDEENAIDQGYAACYAGKGREANPYPRGTEEYNDWDQAWSDGQNELSQGNASWRTGPEHDEDEEGRHNLGRHQYCPDENGRCQLGWPEDRCPAFVGVEDEGENEWGGNAYDQQGAHMGGAKDTDTMDTDVNPEAADELDLDDDLGDNEAETGDDQKLDALTDKASEDPDRQGVIRTVKSAHLVYKRQTEDGTYEELWIYNIGNMRDELDVRKAILAGTDIPTSKTASPDGTQQYELWSAGNAELLQIRGLPN
jgi:ribosome modulation factor